MYKYGLLAMCEHEYGPSSMLREEKHAA